MGEKFRSMTSCTYQCFEFRKIGYIPKEVRGIINLTFRYMLQKTKFVETFLFRSNFFYPLAPGSLFAQESQKTQPSFTIFSRKNGWTKYGFHYSTKNYFRNPHSFRKKKKKTSYITHALKGFYGGWSPLILLKWSSNILSSLSHLLFLFFIANVNCL